MNTKTTPKRWAEIAEAAEACGASYWAQRKWLARSKIPADWKLKIVNYSDGRITLADMEFGPLPQEAAE